MIKLEGRSCITSSLSLEFPWK